MGLFRKLFDTEYKELKRFEKIADKIVALEEEYGAMSDEELRAKTDEFKEILSKRPTSSDFKTDRKLEKEAFKKGGNNLL